MENTRVNTPEVYTCALLGYLSDYTLVIFDYLLNKNAIYHPTPVEFKMAILLMRNRNAFQVHCYPASQLHLIGVDVDPSLVYTGIAYADLGFLGNCRQQPMWIECPCHTAIRMSYNTDGVIQRDSCLTLNKLSDFLKSGFVLDKGIAPYELLLCNGGNSLIRHDLSTVSLATAREVHRDVAYMMVPDGVNTLKLYGDYATCILNLPSTLSSLSLGGRYQSVKLNYEDNGQFLWLYFDDIEIDTLDFGKFTPSLIKGTVTRVYSHKPKIIVREVRCTRKTAEWLKNFASIENHNVRYVFTDE